MLILAPFSIYLPRVALSGVLIVIGIAMIDRHKIRYHWRSSRSDAAIMVVTLLGTLFLRIDFAVLVGILLSLATYIVKTSTPRVQSVVPDDDFNHLLHQPQKPLCSQLAIFDILGDLYFGAVTYVENALHQQQLRHPAQRFLLLRMRSVQVCDSSGIRMLERVVRAYRERGGDVYLMRVQAPIRQLMQRTGFLDYLGADHVLADDTAVKHLFYKVLDPAICIYECPVRVFKECQNLPRSDRVITFSPDLELRPGQVAEITPDQLWRQLHANEPPLIVDVREPREYQRGHIAQAQLLPLAALVTTNADLPRDRPIVFVCRGGRRSGRVAYWFQQKGYAQVAILSGGMQAWEAAGLLEAVTS
jgi:SulP family sulfate permease